MNLGVFHVCDLSYCCLVPAVWAVVSVPGPGDVVLCDLRNSGHLQGHAFGVQYSHLEQQSNGHLLSSFLLLLLLSPLSSSSSPSIFLLSWELVVGFKLLLSYAPVHSISLLRGTMWSVSSVHNS